MPTERETPHPNPDPQVRDRAGRRSLTSSSIHGSRPWARWFVLLGLVLCVGVSPVVVGCLGGVGSAGRAAGARSALGGAVCPLDGRGVRVVELSRGRVPLVVAHIERSWREGFPGRVYRVRRVGAGARRDRLLAWWERAHPQRVGDGLDLDEEPAAVLRGSWRAHVEPLDAHQNRSAGATLGRGISGCVEGTRVRWRFVP